MKEGFDSISQGLIDQVRANLEALSKEPKTFKRNLKAMGYVNSVFVAIGIPMVIVGGHALELYTFGSYTTLDVDVVLSGHQVAGGVFEALGFNKRRAGHRHWYHEGLELPVEIPDSVLFGSMNRIVEVDIEGVSVFVIGIEDLILDRLRAGVHWKSVSDMEWAKYLIDSYADKLDEQYLGEQASDPKNDVYEALMNILANE
jgi:hypothetical protein